MKRPATFRLSDEGHRILRALAQKWRISMTAALEVMLSKVAKEEEV